jgi:DNA-binding GntR family transcriptional regulator
LRDSILAGRIKPGAYLSQVEVARELGVSRTPLREALCRLHESGLIAGEPNFRSHVLGLDPEEIESTYIKRVILEGFSVLCTAIGASGAQLRDLRSGLTQLRGQRENRLSRDEIRDPVRADGWRDRQCVVPRGSGVNTDGVHIQCIQTYRQRMGEIGLPEQSDTALQGRA